MTVILPKKKLPVQTVGYWDDATSFPYGPFVAVSSPGKNGTYRIERANASGKGSCHLGLKELDAIKVQFNREFFWEDLDTLGPVICWLNEQVKGGKL